MNVQVAQADPIYVVMMRHVGPYETIGPVFERLLTWVNEQKIPVQRTIGIYWDNPDFTDASALRSAACVEVWKGYQLPDHRILNLEQMEIAGGPYAIMRFVGPYEDLGPIWSDFTNHIERNLRRKIAQTPAFEVYVNDASNTPLDQLITDLYMPLD